MTAFWVWFSTGVFTPKIEIHLVAETPKDAAKELMSDGGFYLNGMHENSPKTFIPYWRITSIALKPQDPAGGNQKT